MIKYLLINLRVNFGEARISYTQHRSSNKGFRVNHSIRAREVFLIDESGESLGVMSAEEALRTAKDRDYDLVEVGPIANPPVCKILDFGKLKYELEKKNQKAKSNKSGEIKEIRLGVNTEDHDFNTQVEKAKKFLAKGYKIRITVKMSGRQNIYSDRAHAMIERFRETLGLEYDVKPSRMGTRISATLLKGK